MRLSKRVAALIATTGLVVSTIAVAGALITSSTGSVIRLSTPPVSVALDKLQNATSVHAFDEKQGVTLAAPVNVDIVNAGTYSSFGSGGSTIPAGTVVDSHLIHSDPPSKNYTPRRKGSVTFSDQVLGLIVTTSKLGASDGPLGATGTTYSGNLLLRGPETWEDKVTLSADKKTVTFDVTTTIIMDEIRVVTKARTNLVTTVTDEPDEAVTVGNDVQYTLTVTNSGTAPVADVHVVDTLPAGTTVVSAEAPGGCTGTGPVDCTLGTLAVGGSAQAILLVTAPSSVPAGGTITNTAVATPGSNPPGSATTIVEAPEDGVTKGFVSPGGSLRTPGDDAATLSLPTGDGDGAAVIITQGAGTFCDGPCEGTTTTINDFDGYNDPNFPIRVRLEFDFPDSESSLEDAADAYAADIYKNTDPENPSVGSLVPFCATEGAGVAIPSPCIDDRSLTQTSPNVFLVTFDIVYLSGDPKFGRR
jgi:uncharacterized repeat protein (TIGR01451 family)